jgi:predicted molibdopterin-dependent oxidoreductase YjgC
MPPKMFLKTETPEETVTITFDARTLTVPANVTVAAALLGEGINRLRNSVVGDQPRAPYCLMGIIDGVQNRQACMTLVANGMIISSQSGARRVEP